MVGRLDDVRDAITRDRVLIALATATRFSSGVLMGTALAVHVERFGGSPFAVSVLYTAYFVGLMVFAPVWGAVADVTGRRRAVLVASGALATIALLPLFAVRASLTVALPVGPALAVPDVWQLVGLRGLYAVFAAGYPPVMLAVVSDRGGESGRGRSLGFFNSARATGFTSGQLAVGVLLGVLVPRSLYAVIVGVSLVATVAVALVADRTPAREPSLGAVLSEIRTRLVPAAGERGHLRTNGLGWLYAALALRNMTVMGVMSLMPVFLTGPVGVPEAVMGVLLALNPAGQIVCMYLLGRVADAAGRKPLIVAGMAGSGAFAVLTGVATMPAALSARVGVAALGFVVIAASFSAMTTGSLAFIGDVSPPGRESELMGLRSTAKGVGGVVGPPLFGVLATIAGYRTAYLLGSLLAFVAALLAWTRLVETRAPAATAATADD